MELLNYVLQSTSDFLFSHTSVIWLGSCIGVSYCPSINAFISFPIRWDFLLLCWFCLSFACQHLVHLDFQCFIYLSIFLCHTVVSLLIVWSLSPWLSLLRKRLKPFKMVVTRYNAESAPGGLGVGGNVRLLFPCWWDFHSFQRARDTYLKDWDLQRQRLPDSRCMICDLLIRF